MPNNKRKKEVANNVEISPTIVGPSSTLIEVEIEPQKPLIEEKVEVIIKEIIRIKPGDFSAFKHDLEEFVSRWDSYS